MDEFFESLRGAKWSHECGMIFVMLPKYGPTHLFDVRGWGHLTGKGLACGYDEKTAMTIQRKMGDLAVDAIGSYRRRKQVMQEACSTFAKIRHLLNQVKGSDNPDAVLNEIHRLTDDIGHNLSLEIGLIESKGLDDV